MKIDFRVSDSLRIEQDVKDSKQAFQFIAYLQTIFGVKRCGNCDCDRLHLSHRTTTEGHDYYSVVCDECKHELKFGQTKVGNKLFAKGWEEPYQSDDDKSKNKNKNKSKPRDEENEYETAGVGSDGDSDDAPW